MSNQSLTVALLAACLCLTMASVNADTAQAPVDANPVPVPAAPAPQPQAGSTLPALPVQPPATAPDAAPSATPAPTAVAPVAAPVPAAPAVADAIDPNAAAREAGTLNDLLIPTDNGLQDSIEAGRTIGAGKQDFIDVLGAGNRAFEYRTGGMLGEKRRATGLAVWFTPDLCARWLGFIEQRSFANSDVQQADFTALQQEVTASQRTLTFLVEIGDLVPLKKHSLPATEAQANAALAQMSNIHFVLSDDRGVNYSPSDVSTPASVSVRQAFYDDLSVNPERIVPEVSASTIVTPDRLVKRRSPYGDYAAFYVVRFAAFNPDGTARIGRDTKAVTLRVLDGDDVRSAAFELSTLP